MTDTSIFNHDTDVEVLIDKASDPMPFDNNYLPPLSPEELAEDTGAPEEWVLDNMPLPELPQEETDWSTVGTLEPLSEEDNLQLEWEMAGRETRGFILQNPKFRDRARELSWTEDLVNQFEAGWTEAERGNIIGEALTAGNVDILDDPRVVGLKDDLMYRGEAEFWSGEAARMVGQVAEGIFTWKTAAVATGTGAVGAAGGAAGGPLAPITVPAGALIGAGAGVGAKLAVDSFYQNRAEQFESMIAMGFPTQVASDTSLLTGIANAALDVVGTGTLVGAPAKVLLKGKLKKVMQSKSFQRKAAEFVAVWQGGALGEGATEALQELINGWGTNLAIQFHDLDIEALSTEQITDNMLHAFDKAYKASLFISGGSATVSTVVQHRHQKRQEMIDQVRAAVDGDPERAKVAGRTSKTPYEFNAVALKQLFVDDKIPEAWIEQLGFTKREVELAAESGATLTLDEDGKAVFLTMEREEAQPLMDVMVNPGGDTTTTQAINDAIEDAAEKQSIDEETNAQLAEIQQTIEEMGPEALTPEQIAIMDMAQRQAELADADQAQMDMFPEGSPEVQAAEDALALNELLRAGRKAGFTNRQMEENLALRAEVRERQARREDVKKVKAEKRAVSKEVREQKKKARAEGKKQWEENRHTKMRKDVRAGGVRIDPSSVGNYQLPARSGLLAKGAKEIGLDIEDFAHYHGYEDVNEMLAEMNSFEGETMTSFVKDFVNTTMTELHSDILTQEGQLASTLEDLLDTSDVSIMLAQRLIGLKQEWKNTTAKQRSKMIKAVANARLGDLTLTEASFNRMLREIQSLGVQAGIYARKGDTQKAFDYTYAHAVRYEMLREMQRRGKRVDKKLKTYQKRYAGKLRVSNVHGTMQYYIQDFLSIAQLRPGDKGRPTTLTPETLNSLLTRYGLQHIQNLPWKIIEEGNRRPLRDFTISELESLIEAVEHLEGIGKEMTNRDKAIRAGLYNFDKEVMLAQVSRNHVSNLQKARAEETIQDSKFLRGAEWILSWAAHIRRVEDMLEILDGGDRNGPWKKAIFGRFVAAQDLKDRLRHDIMGVRNPKLDEAIGRKPKHKFNLMALQDHMYKNRKEWTESHTIAGVPGTKQWTKGEAFMIALNMGTKSNKERVLAHNGVMEGHTLNEDQVNLILDLLNEDDMVFVQGLWDAFRIHTWDKVKAVFQLENNGLNPTEVVTSPFPHKGKVYEGGYFPILYDPRAINKTETGNITLQAQRDAQDQLEQVMSPQVSDAVFSGMTKERSGSRGKLLLDMTVLPNAIDDVIHYIAYRPQVREVLTILNDPEMATEIRVSLGQAYFNEIKRWTGRLATNNRGDHLHSGLQRMARYWNSVAGTAVLGYKLTTMVAQPMGAFPAIMEQINAPVPGKPNFWSAKGITRAGRITRRQISYLYKANTKEAYQFIMSKSREMPSRRDMINLAVAEYMSSAKFGPQGKISRWHRKYNDFAKDVITSIQLTTVDMPTWLNAYNTAMEDGMRPDQAVDIADSVLRQTQASAQLKDTVEMMSTPAGRSALLFMTFFVSQMNRMASNIGAARRGERGWHTLGGDVAMWVLIPAMLDELVRGNLDFEDDDDLIDVGRRILLYPVAPIASLLNGNMSQSQIGRLLRRVSNLNPDEPETWVPALLQLLMTASGTAGAVQISATLEALMQNDAEFVEYYMGPKR